MAAAGKGLALLHCKRCVQHRARHGSTFAATIPAATLRPYLRTAEAWVREHKGDPRAAYALMGLQGLLGASGEAAPAMDLKWRTAGAKARVAFARLREAGIKAERLLSIHLGVAACIEDDGYADRSSDYRLTQSAKVCHRLASGTHRKWDFPVADGTTRPLELHAYPKSSGQVLRIVGRELEELCGAIVELAAAEVRRVKRERYGPHPSELPGFKPPWQLARDKAAAAALRKAGGKRR